MFKRGQISLELILLLFALLVTILFVANNYSLTTLLTYNNVNQSTNLISIIDQNNAIYSKLPHKPYWIAENGSIILKINLHEGNNTIYIKLFGNDTSDISNVALELGNISDINVNIAQSFAGGQHILYLMDDGSLYSCGCNVFGQLGIGNTSETHIPIKIPTISNTSKIIKVACGAHHTLVLLDNGDVYGFGYNEYGQLGLGDTINRLSPTKIPIFENVTNIWAGPLNSFVQYANGSVYGVGTSEHGEIGTATTIITTPRLIEVPNIIDVAPGGLHTIVLSSNGSAYASGYNDYGELGIGSTKSKTKFTLIPSLINIVDVECGLGNSMFIDSSGNVYSCGLNMYGELACGSTNLYEVTPLPILISDVKQINPSTTFTMILQNNGSLWVVGSNEGGNLGLPNVSGYTNTITLVDYILPVKSIPTTTMSLSTPIILENGEIMVTGLNTFGQLGLEHTTDQYSYVQLNRNLFIEDTKLIDNIICTIIYLGEEYYYVPTSASLLTHISSLEQISEDTLKVTYYSFDNITDGIIIIDPEIMDLINGDSDNYLIYQ